MASLTQFPGNTPLMKPPADSIWKVLARHLLRRLPFLRCTFGCRDAVVGVYWMNCGCAARNDQRFQPLCAQHLISAEPIDQMRCLIDIWPVEFD
jgi:hypothetical protein